MGLFSKLWKTKDERKQLEDKREQDLWKHSVLSGNLSSVTHSTSPRAYIDDYGSVMHHLKWVKEKVAQFQREGQPVPDSFSNYIEEVEKNRDSFNRDFILRFHEKVKEEIKNAKTDNERRNAIEAFRADLHDAMHYIHEYKYFSEEDWKLFWKLYIEDRVAYKHLSGWHEIDHLHIIDIFRIVLGFVAFDAESREQEKKYLEKFRSGMEERNAYLDDENKAYWRMLYDEYVSVWEMQ